MFDLLKPVRSMSPKDAYEAWNSDLDRTAILDVRTLEELRVTSIPGAIHIPLDVLPNELDRLHGYSRVFPICRSGGRSARATALLSGVGILAANIQGGIIAWERAGLPVVRGA